MKDVKQQLTRLFKSNNINVANHRMEALGQFSQAEQNVADINLILEKEVALMTRWKQKERIADIIQQPLRVLNATVGKPYETKLDFDKLKWVDITDFYFEGLEDVGLHFDDKTRQIMGVPTQSGDRRITFKFKVEAQIEEEAYNEKTFTLIINPDPRSLWKKIETDKNLPYWKEDDVTVFEPLGDRHILVSSKRGRAHANVGSFREDDYAFAELPNNWNIVVVSDGAGSAKLSRKGSSIACNGIVEHFGETSSVEGMAEIDEILQQAAADRDEEGSRTINRLVYNNLGKAAFAVHKKLEAFSRNEGIPLKDLNSTLIFTLFKKYPFGYALLSFGVGDCPIGVLNKDLSEITLMNWLDVGDFGGGTRFITMPEIFQSDKFATRFGFKVVEDFSYLIMMSDGVYDPKFVVEANLKDIKKWQDFLADISGKNDENIQVDLSIGNPDIVSQFSAWMDFWSAGNHDDRTLAIVF
ncbi:MAG: protein phosphatase 2C domain-containing protein [Gemmatimonadaceae bacterium]|nr:protein phosphatase 2C domain-containing protein [Chitinophagaceae bacterium]